MSKKIILYITFIFILLGTSLVVLIVTAPERRVIICNKSIDLIEFELLLFWGNEEPVIREKSQLEKHKCETMEFQLEIETYFKIKFNNKIYPLTYHGGFPYVTVIELDLFEDYIEDISYRKYF